MRPSHTLAALGATTITISNNLAQAQNTSPLPDAIAQQSVDCTTTSSATTTWSLPTVSAVSTRPASFTLTVGISPANGTSSSSEEAASSSAAPTSPPPPTTTATTADSTTATATASPSSSVAAAAPGEGLSSDSSMLGLVVFFALSLCLL